MELDEYSDEDIQAWLKDYKPSACSGIRNGNYFGRNYDWNYSNTVTVVIKVPAKEGRHASIGICSNDDISKIIADNNSYVEAFRVLPYFTLDGINDAGVVCSTNVVPLDKGFTKGTNPGKKDICQISLPRFILDNADSAIDGIKKLNNYNIWSIANELGSELHMMVADKDATYIVEFVNNKMNVLSDQSDDGYDDIPNGKAIMTNFHLSGWNGDIKAVFLGDTEEEVKQTGLENHAEGLERYSILSDNYSKLTSLDDTLDTMKLVDYTRTYLDSINPLWYSECTGATETFGDLTIYNKPEDFEGVRSYMQDLYANRNRDEANTWQTVHSTAYNIENKKFIIRVQEEDSVYSFELGD